MRFEEILPALREGKKIRRKNRNKINYIQIGKEDFIVDENDECFPFILEDFLADNWEIIKEKKKVKLRDLTKEQYKNWYKGHCYLYEDCEHCCFKTVQCDYTYERCWINHKDVYSDKFLDQEIEVEE